MVRTFLLVAAIAATSLLGSASAGAARTSLSLSVSGYKVLAGHPLTLSGRLGNRLPGQSISILAWPYGRSAPVHVATVTTGPEGSWSFAAKPMVQTTYAARWHASTTSPKVTVGVRPAITVRVLDNGHVSVGLDAGRSLAGSTLQLQRLTGATWQTVMTKKLSSASIAAFAPAFPASTLRAALSVNQAGKGLLGSTSHGFVYRPRSLTLTASASKVLYGHPLTLSGRLVNGRAGMPVSILARGFGTSAPATIGIVTTGAGGTWSWRVGPAIQTTYAARAAGKTSPNAIVGVKPLVTVRELANGHVWTSVQAGRSFGGQKVQLQRQVAGGAWQTLAEKRLGSASSAVFMLPLPGSTLRVAMSVNQAGKGYLGSASHALVYRPV